MEHDRSSTKTLRLANKVVLQSSIMIANAGFIPVMNRAEAQDWYLKAGLVTTMASTLAFSAVMPIIKGCFDTGLLWNKFWHLRKVRKLVKEGRKVKASAKHLIKLNEPSEISLPDRLSEAIQLIVVSALVTPLIPWAPLFPIAGLFGMYAVDKYMICNHYRRPEVRYDASIIEESMRMIGFFLLIVYPLAAWWFLSPTVEDSGWMHIGMFVALGLGVISWATPLNLCRLLCCTQFCQRNSERTDTAEDYYKAQFRWGKLMKYWKNQWVYRSLDDEVNPELLLPPRNIVAPVPPELTLQSEDSHEDGGASPEGSNAPELPEFESERECYDYAYLMGCHRNSRSIFQACGTYLDMCRLSPSMHTDAPDSPIPGLEHVEMTQKEIV